MLKVFIDYGVSAKAAIACLVTALLIGIVIALNLVTLPQALVIAGVWVVVMFLVLPTRHLLLEQIGGTRILPKCDRRAARLIQVKQRRLFVCAGLVGWQHKERRRKNNPGGIKRIEIPQYPTLSKPVIAPYGFYYQVGLPGYCAITAAKAIKCQDLIDGYVSHLLRRTYPMVKVEVEQLSGCTVRLEIRIREEFASIVAPNEVT